MIAISLSSRGLELEVAGREITGRPVPGRARRPYAAYLMIAPAFALSSLLVVPILITTVTAFRTGGGFGVANFAVLGDPDALRAVRNSLAWVLVALALVVAGFVIALVGYRLPRVGAVLQPVLVMPFAVSMLVSGATFRIIYDAAPERGTVTALATELFGGSPVWLGPGLFWLVVVSAFGWTWLGYAVSLFRSGLEAIPVDLGRTVSAEGLRGWRRLATVELPILRPITGIVTLTLVVAAVRLFDLVLITVPGPMQHDADVLALHWWRATNTAGEAGRPAALALTLFAVVSVVAIAGVRGLRRRWAMPAAPITRAAPVVPRAPERPDRRTRVIGSTAGVVICLVWIFPAVVLLATALHSPRAAGLGGWWRSDGLGLDSFTAAAHAGLWQALASTLLIAVVATVVLLVVAVPTAYAIAWGGLPRRLGGVLMAAMVVLTVAPVPMYAAPLREAFDAFGLTGSRISLALVHAAAGLPFAVLLLRSAFASSPPSLVAEALQGQVRQSAAMTAVRHTYRPALVAVAVLELMLVWNDFIVGFLVSGPGTTPLSLVLWGEARQFATSAGTVAAAAVVSSVVPVMLLLRFWPTVVRGLTVGTKP